MLLCEENHYAEAELILKEGELVAEANDNQLDLQKCQGTRYSQTIEWAASYDHLTARLYTYLILQDMGKHDDDIAQILCVSPSAVRSIKSRVKARKK